MCVKFPTAHNRRAGEPVSSVVPLFRLRGTLFSAQQLTSYTGIPKGTARAIITCAMPNCGTMVMAQTQVQTQLTPQRSERDWPFKVKPLHPVLGCEITGITLAEAVSPALFAKVYEAFLTYELILFRDVDLPPATQVAFARNFGEVQVHVLSQYHGYKEHPEIYMLSNLDKDGKPSGKHPDRGTLYWHTDGSWKERTGQATMMYSEIVPASGGETEFADMYSAYDLCLRR